MADDFSDIATPVPKKADKKPAVKRLDAKPAPADDFSDIASTSMPEPMHIFGSTYVTKDNEKEGRYLMEKDGKNEDVPFSSVAAAMSDGFNIAWVDHKRYANDFKYFAKQQKAETPPKGYWSNLWDEAKSIPEGVGSLVKPPESKAGKVAEAVLGPAAIGAVAVPRLLKSEAQSRPKAIEQSNQQAEEAKGIRDPLISKLEDIRSVATLMSALVPVPGIAAMTTKINQAIDRGDLAGAWGMATVDIPLLLTGLKSSGQITDVAKDTATKVIDRMVEKYRPTTADVGGEKVPMLQSEAHPESKVGQYVEDTKRRGVAPRQFKQVERKQQEAVKDVIRNVARETSDFVGPMQLEPGAAMSDAATAVFKSAKPMYKALDDSLASVPKDWSTASKLLNTAIARAQKLGVEITPAEEPVSVIVDKAGNIIDQQAFSKARTEENLNSGEWHEEEMQLNKQPIQDFQAVRSELLDMQRTALAAGDLNKARVIGDEVRTMNQEAENALKGTELYKNWREADRLWSKGYAISEVADALNAVTKGTPEGVITDPNISQVPTEIQGASLVNRLNTLAENGVLDKAFNPQQIKNLRTSAYIIDRAQAVRSGTSTGETASRSRAITHLLGGSSALPTAGAVAGGMIGALHGHFLTGAELGTFLGFVGQVVQRRALATAMTTLDGVNALRDLSQARTPTASTIAMRRLIVAARAASKNKDKVGPASDDQQNDKKKPEILGPQSSVTPTHIWNAETEEIEPVAA